MRLVSAATRISSGLTWRRRGTGLACLLKDKINQLASGVGVRVVRKMPHRSKKNSPSIARIRQPRSSRSTDSCMIGASAVIRAR